MEGKSKASRLDTLFAIFGNISYFTIWWKEFHVSPRSLPTWAWITAKDATSKSGHGGIYTPFQQSTSEDFHEKMQTG